MEGKKSFILYADLITVIEKLSDEQAGVLFKIIMDYVNDKDPIIDDLLMQVAFQPIKNQLKRDLKIWQGQRQQRSDAGKKGMEKRWGKDNTVKKGITKDNTVIKPITDITDNVNVTDNVIDTDTDNVIKKKHLFLISEYYELDKFIIEIKSNDKYLPFDCEYYHECIINWSAEGNMKKDWIATARNWMLRDVKDGKAKLEKEYEQKFKQNGKQSYHDKIDEYLNRDRNY